MSTVCGRCAASLKLTRQRQLLSNNTSTTFTPSAARGSVYGLYSLVYPSIGHISRRHASSGRDKRTTSSTATTSPPPKSFLGESRFSITQNINPPLSTLPLDLDLPPAPTSDETFSQRSWRRMKIAGKYLVFYRDGIKNVYRNWKASVPIRRQLGLPSYIPTSPPSSARDPSSGATSLRTAIETLQITRSDFQLVRRAAYDVRRLIPFGILFVICGEFTPLVVAVIGDAVTPYTCRIPKQLAKTRAKRLEQKQRAFAAVQGGLGSMKPMRDEDVMTWQAEQFGSREFAATASAEQVLRACAVFGLAKSHDRGAGLVPLIYRPRLKRWTEYLALDDQLIVESGGVEYLSAQEVRIAIEERGGFEPSADVRRAGQVEKAERQWLKQWLKRRNFIE